MSTEIFKLVVCSSGGGGNFQAILNAAKTLDIDVALLIADRECGAVDRAIQHSVPWVRLDISGGRPQTFEHFESVIPADIDLIVLAGFMPIVPPDTCNKWVGKMINTHPSLLPSYGGKGMYGVKVQEAVMAAREKYAGCTVHFVDHQIDGGKTILQRSLEVDYQATPWQLGGRIFEAENRLIVDAIKLVKDNPNLYWEI